MSDSDRPAKPSWPVVEQRQVRPAERPRPAGDAGREVRGRGAPQGRTPVARRSPGRERVAAGADSTGHSPTSAIPRKGSLRRPSTRAPVRTGAVLATSRSARRSKPQKELSSPAATSRTRPTVSRSAPSAWRWSRRSRKGTRSSPASPSSPIPTTRRRRAAPAVSSCGNTAATSISSSPTSSATARYRLSALLPMPFDAAAGMSVRSMRFELADPIRMPSRTGTRDKHASDN